ncbi:hypothetical protein CfE428DRAFT_5521 [Chthoniobacter flavus Ellin428]|uniref:Uncharacterized protein n=1 Tax=Chthoniobacter flavus Ellin428 TaxID=497964 RepID=B4D9D1_9BACT|nr:hypothetical protein CfE428DRAFT_5521 [Chthoniobacter flavus Ellin428]TCO87775.1 hypothetical protein EV701_12074 [Chthoniobacter flavus]
MRLLFDLAVVVPILLLALAAEPYLKASAGKILALQWLVYIVTFALIAACRTTRNGTARWKTVSHQR